MSRGQRTRLVQPVLKRVSPRRACHKRAHLIKSQKRHESRSFARNAKLTAGPIKLTTRLIVAIGTTMVISPDSLALSRPINISPVRRMGARKGWHT